MSNVVRISFEDNILGVHLDLGGDVFKDETVVGAGDIPGTGALVHNWILKSMKPLFKRMPLQNVEFECSKEMSDTYPKEFGTVVGTLYATNEYIKEHKELKGIANDYDGVLFFNCSDDIRYKAFYEFLKETNPDIHYLNQALGFNRVKRKWETPPDPMPLDELFDYLIENKIKKIFTINTYVLDKYIMFAGVNLIPVCDYLGIEWINIDHDPPDLRAQGYLHKAFLSSDKVKRFTCKSILQRHFDDKYGINCHYVAIPQNYNGSSPQKMDLLDKDYDIVVLSNSRWNDVEPLLPVIGWLMEQLPPATAFRDLHLWYLALRKMVLDAPLPEFQQLQVSSSLHTVMYMARNYLKYIILGALQTDREVLVYGDEGWNNVCPQYYQKSLNNEEIKKLYSENNHLYLLMNFSYSYLDASGPVYDVINQGIPFINVAPVFRTPALGGMVHVEYDGPQRLNYLANNFIRLYNYAGSFVGIDTYRDILASSAEDIRNSLEGKPINGVFTQHLSEHQQLADGMIAEYTVENKDFLDYTYKRFVGG